MIISSFCLTPSKYFYLLKNKTLDNTLVVKLLQKLHLLSDAHKTIFLCWIPSHIGIRGIEAAKESLKFNVTASQVPYTVK